MAKEDAKDKNEAVAPKKSKVMLFAIIGVLVVGLGAGGGVFFYFQSVQAKPKTAKVEKKGPPVFVKFDPMVVNINSDVESHYLQVSLEMKTFDPKVADEIKLQMPELRDGILSLLTVVNPETVNNQAEREKLRQKILSLSNKTLKRDDEEEHGDDKSAADKAGPVDGVYFTAFVMQ